MRRVQDRARSATIKSRALGALKLASEASCARSARWECAREAGRFFSMFLNSFDETNKYSLYFFYHFTEAQTNFIILKMMWITHFLKFTKFLFQFKWNRKFNLLKALSALRNTFSTWHSRFALYFLYTFQ